MLPVIDMEATGVNIDRLRRKSGLTVRDIQKAFGFKTPRSIYKWMQGVSLPSVDNLIALAYILNITVEDIIVTERFPKD